MRQTTKLSVVLSKPIQIGNFYTVLKGLSQAFISMRCFTKAALLNQSSRQREGLKCEMRPSNGSHPVPLSLVTIAQWNHPFPFRTRK